MLVSTAAILHDPTDNEPTVSDEKKAVFYAAAELNVRSLYLRLLSKVLMFSIQGRTSPTRHSPRIDKV
jgi:hypothetical protein